MDIKEMIKEYDIILWEENAICVRNQVRIKKDKAIEIIKDKKPEIIAYLKEEKEKEKRNFELRQAKINAIEGLHEIESAIEEQMKWKADFERAMDKEECVFRAKPQNNIDELKKKYPRAAAYLKAEAESLKRNYELSEIGKDALERIINGEDYIKVLSDMDKRQHEFCQKHFWD